MQVCINLTHIDYTDNKHWLWGEDMTGACCSFPPVTRASFSVKMSKIRVLFLCCRLETKIDGLEMYGIMYSEQTLQN